MSSQVKKIIEKELHKHKEYLKNQEEARNWQDISLSETKDRIFEIKQKIIELEDFIKTLEKGDLKNEQ